MTRASATSDNVCQSARRSPTCPLRATDLSRDRVNHRQSPCVKTMSAPCRRLIWRFAMSIQRKQLWGALAGALLAVSVPAALAGEITLYEQRDFRGDSLTLHRAATNLDRSGLNDSVSSLVVRDGVWEVCTDAFFRGACAQLQPGEYRRLDGPLNDHISSVRASAIARLRCGSRRVTGCSVVIRNSRAIAVRWAQASMPGCRAKSTAGLHRCAA